MMRHLLCIVPALVFTALAFPSEPGDFLDCTDVVLHEPGLACEEVLDCDALSPPGFSEMVGCNWGSDGDWSVPRLVLDNEGDVYLIAWEPTPTGCGVLNGYTLARLDGTSWTPVAEIDSRCVDPGSGELDAVSWSNRLVFDDKTGRFLIRMAVAREGGNYLARLIAITGFTSTFDIAQSYEPGATAWSFRVPIHPEALPAADFFDTYFGSLDTVGDWSQAQPLQCGYPATFPSAGDYLTVDDPLPDPPPGHGRYYVTAVNYQGQMRFGRKTSGGVLSGREPGVLPLCN